MLVNDNAISDLIRKISVHYNNNISTRILRPLYTRFLANTEVSRHISSLTDRAEEFLMYGYHLEDLYLQVLALAEFIFFVRSEILSNLRYYQNQSPGLSTDRVYWRMALDNLKPNIDILAGDLQTLYKKMLEYDKAQARGRRTIAERTPRLAQLPNLLGLDEHY